MEGNSEEIKNTLLDTVAKQDKHLKEQQKVLNELIGILKAQVEQNSATQNVVAQPAEISQPEPVHVEPVPVLQNEHVQESLGHVEPHPALHELEPPTVIWFRM